MNKRLIEWTFLVHWSLCFLGFFGIYMYGCINMDGRLSLFIIFDAVYLMFMSLLLSFSAFTVVRKMMNGRAISLYASVAALYTAGAFTTLYVFLFKYQEIAIGTQIAIALALFYTGSILHRRASVK